MHARRHAPAATISHRPLLPCNATHLAVYVIFEHQTLVVLGPLMTKLDAASVVDESHHIIHRPLVLQDVAAPPPPRSVKGPVTAGEESAKHALAAIRANNVQRPPPVHTLCSGSGTDLLYPATQARERALLRHGAAGNAGRACCASIACCSRSGAVRSAATDQIRSRQLRGRGGRVRCKGWLDGRTFGLVRVHIYMLHGRGGGPRGAKGPRGAQPRGPPDLGGGGAAAAADARLAAAQPPPPPPPPDSLALPQPQPLGRGLAVRRGKIRSKAEFLYC